MLSKRQDPGVLKDPKSSFVSVFRWVHRSAKQGHNVLGSVRLSVCQSVSTLTPEDQEPPLPV